MDQGSDRISDRLTEGGGGARPASVTGGRVLMLCYFFPPINTSGTSRNAAFARHLPSLGWQPTVLTVSEPKDSWGVMAMDKAVEDSEKVVRTREWNITRVVDLMDAVYDRALGRHGARFRDFLCVPDPQLGWAPVRKARSLAGDHDCIYVSASPFSSALWGAWVGKKTGKPLVVDFRDPWTLNPYTSHTAWHKAIARRQEQWVIENSAAVIVNTEGTCRLYRDHYPDMADKFVWIPNGYDRLNPATAPNQRRPFRIMHFGSFYGARNPARILQAMKALPDLDMEFVQVGPGDGIDHTDQRVRVIPAVSHEKAGKMMRHASLLYLKQGEAKKGTRPVSVAAKTYEYLATGLPVLAECPEGDNADIVRRYANRGYVVSDGRIASLKSALQNAYAEHLSYHPAIRHEFTEDFSRRRLAQRLARVLEGVTA